MGKIGVSWKVYEEQVKKKLFFPNIKSKRDRGRQRSKLATWQACVNGWWNDEGALIKATKKKKKYG